MGVNNCPKCGNKLDGPEKHCSSCGAEHQNKEGANQLSPNADNSRPASKRRKLIIILSLIVVLVIAGIVCGLLFYKSSPKTTKDNNVHSECEPVEVITPPSHSRENIPDEKNVQVLVDPSGKVYMNMTDTID